MCGSECKKRIESVQAGLGRGAVLLLSSGSDSSSVNPSFYYFTGLEIDGCLLAVSHDSSSLICPQMNHEYAASHSPGMEIKKYGSRQEFSKAMKSAIGKAATLLLDYPSTRLSFAESLSKYTRAKREDFSEKIASMRAVKSDSELKALKQSVSEAESLLSFLESNICEGASEKKIESMLLSQMLERNLKPSFAPIVASGANSSMPHSHPTNNKVKGHVLIDMGVKVDGYCSDLTRCFFLGSSARMQKNAYDKITLVCDEICDRAESGSFSKASELAAESALLLERYGLPPLPHSIGHGIGIEVHESPSLGPKSKDLLSKGMALAIEPAAYYPGKFGVRYERDVFL